MLGSVVTMAVSVFPEKDERSQVVLYGPKGEPLYRVKPKFGYRTKEYDD